jgi:hypothetical protein
MKNKWGRGNERKYIFTGKAVPAYPAGSGTL